MAEEPGQRIWWATLPGVLTGMAALVTAITGLVVAFRPADKAMPAPAPNGSTMAEPVPAGKAGPGPAVAKPSDTPHATDGGSGGTGVAANPGPDKTPDAAPPSALPGPQVKVNQDRWSTDIDKPTPLWTRDLQGGAPGRERDYFFALQTSGPGEITLTLDVTGRSSAATVMWRLTDRDANEIAAGYVAAPYQKRLERKVERFDAGRSLPLVLRLSVDGEVQAFRVKLEGPLALP